MRSKMIHAALAVVVLAGCADLEAAGSKGRKTADTEFDLAEMDWTAAEVVDLMVAQEPTVIDSVCTQAEDLTDAMLDELRPQMSKLLAGAANEWGLKATDLYDAVIDECGR